MFILAFALGGRTLIDPGRAFASTGAIPSQGQGFTLAVLPTLYDADLFDEAGYLRLHPGICTAVANGQFQTGRVHFDRHGRMEGRRPNDVDPHFYVQTYPQVTEVFGPLLAGGCAAHYVAFGRGRGYLPRAGVARAPAQDGLWTDAADALDRIDALEASGALTDRQAAMLRGWWVDGALVLDRPAPQDRVDPAALDIERMFAGACPDVGFHCPAFGSEPVTWQPAMAPQPAAALDPHFVSAPVRDLICRDPVREFARLLLGGNTLLARSRGFIRSPASGPRRASMLFDCTVSKRFVTAWVGLEDGVTLTIWKGSHRFGPIRLPPSPAAPTGLPIKPASWNASDWTEREGVREPLDEAIGRAVSLSGRSADTVRLDRGSVVLLHPDLLHVCSPVASPGTGRAISAELCPEMLMPLYGEQVPTPLYRHGSDRFASGVYRNIEPLT